MKGRQPPSVDFSKFAQLFMGWGKVFSEKRRFFHFHGTRLPVWSTGYWIAQAKLVGITYTLYHSKFQEVGWKEHVPDDKPILFAISHRNAFMDSLAFVHIHDSQVWQLARGDAFKNPLMRKLFYFFHMLPIWRERDGVDTREANEETFNACYDILALNGMVGIYPEGDCINERHIRPLKKGICRIAFGAMEKYNWEIDLHIVPVGVSYTDAEKFGKRQLIQFGPAVRVQTYKEQYQKNSAAAINTLKDELQLRMQDQVVHIPRSHNHHDIDQAVVIGARAFLKEEGSPYTPIASLRKEQELSKKLETIRLNDHEGISHLAKTLHKYVKGRDALDLRENTFDQQRQSMGYRVGMLLVLLLTFPVFITGWITQIIPFRLPQWIVRKNIKQRIFFSSLQYAIGLFTFTFFYLLYFILAWVLSGHFWMAAILLLVLPVWGKSTYLWWRAYKRWLSVVRLKIKLRRKDDTAVHMMADREELLRIMRNAS